MQSAAAWIGWLAGSLACLGAAAAHGGDALHVAVAANFAAPGKEIAARFEEQTGHQVIISTGSTGKLYAQISHGAPFAVFLSADEAHPLRLEQAGMAVAGSRFTYAIGKLVLWSPRAGYVDAQGEVLRQGGFKRLAIANPRLAPYGAAAQQVLEGLGLWAAVAPRLVQGENITQAYQFVASGNAELGFVALSQLAASTDAPAGSRWQVPQALYRPIEQQAVLLQRGEAHAAAQPFLAFLQGEQARAIIARYGYALP